MSSIKHEINLSYLHVRIKEQVHSDDGWCLHLLDSRPLPDVYDPFAMYGLVAGKYGTATMALAAVENYIKAADRTGHDVRVTIDWITTSEQGLRAVRDLTGPRPHLL